MTYGLPPLLYAVNNLLQERSITLVVGTSVLVHIRRTRDVAESLGHYV